MRISTSESAWEDIRRAYCETTEPVKDIAGRYGRHVVTVNSRAAREGWTRPIAQTINKPDPPAKRNRSSARNARLDLEKRLYRIMIRKLEKLERRMESGETFSPADDEREMREIANMIRGFEKVKSAGGDAKPKAVAIDALGSEGLTVRKREEITRRLERLHQKRLAQDDPRTGA